jgi:hypothetical protein
MAFSNAEIRENTCHFRVVSDYFRLSKDDFLIF